MSRRSKAGGSWFTVLLLVAAVAVWVFNAIQDQSPAPLEASNYEKFPESTLVEARNNDGDSFMVRLPDGREAEFRLYFVDAPESAFKSYRGGQTNHERIRGQAADLDVSTGEAVEIGKQAKKYTLEVLGARPFEVFTRWDSPFKDGRYHAFIRMTDDGKPRWLHEQLVRRGLARIKTKPADFPDGTPAADGLERLRELEREAKRVGAGAWAR